MWSETCKISADKSRKHSIIFLVLGCIYLVITTLIVAKGGDILLLLGFGAPCLIFFSASAWDYFVEYPDYKRAQQIAEEEEAKREKAFALAKEQEEKGVHSH